MKEKQKVVAIIPARGGSKSIPHKNIRPLGGVPLLAYSIAAGLESIYVDRVIVSTDNEQIAEIARAWGAETPFLRPAELATDDATDFPLFEHALQWLKEQESYIPDMLVQLRPTSPLRPPGIVDRAVETLLARPEVDSVRGVTPSGQNPYKMWRIEQETLHPLLASEHKEPYNMPRQALPETWWQTGHIEVIRRETILQKRSLTGDIIAPCPVEPEYAIDLDNLFQWDYVEYVLANRDLTIITPTPQPTRSTT